MSILKRPTSFLIFSLLLFVTSSAQNNSTSNTRQSSLENPEWTQQKRVPNQPIFQVVKPDYNKSPFTGITRKHWKDAALYLLNGAFSYVNNIDDAMQFPKQSAKAYPRTPMQVPTEKLEGLCRTLFIAAPLLKENASLKIHNINVAEYYRHQLIKLCDSSSATYIKPRAKNGGPSQILVEFGGLGVSLFAASEVIWDPLTKEQKDALAATMLSYGDGPTIGNNWKFFNIFVLSFFKSKGYEVNEKLLTEYLDKTLQHYRGDGWYNDAPAFDYYSMWAFQMYGPLWSKFFGEKYYPEYAKKFRDNFAPLKDNYPYLFGRTGEMIMWGRSMPYRFASTIPLALTGLEKNASVNYGWMRRIASGALLQFIKNPNFLEDNIPSLGFYGPFEPAVQPYSCRGSVFWLGKAFLSLLLPEENPFWSAKENEGAWQNQFKNGKVCNKFEDSTNILITDYPNIGASEIRAWCHVKAIGANEPFRASENYNRLSYNSAFPWQADSVEGVVAMNYIFRNRQNQWEPLRLYTFKKFENGIYYRDAVLETNANIQMNLADIPLANGILRVDKIRADDSIQLRLGHYALPQLNGAIKSQKKIVKGFNVAIINNGVYQLALVSINRWSDINAIATEGVHPTGKRSTVINASDLFIPGRNKPFYITLMLWKKASEKWTNDELVPISKVEYFGNGSVTLSFINGEKKIVKFD